MGTSYQTVLATGELARIRAALKEARWEAYVAPAGDRRWAVIPREEDDSGWADADAVAELVSKSTGSAAVAFERPPHQVARQPGERWQLNKSTRRGDYS